MWTRCKQHGEEVKIPPKNFLKMWIMWISIRITSSLHRQTGRPLKRLERKQNREKFQYRKMDYRSSKNATEHFVRPRLFVHFSILEFSTVRLSYLTRSVGVSLPAAKSEFYIITISCVGDSFYSVGDSLTVCGKVTGGKDGIYDTEQFLFTSFEINFSSGSTTDI